MSLNDCIKIQENTIDIDGIKTFIDFTRYRSSEQKFVEGLELAEDLNLKTGTTIYTKNTVIIPKHVARLIELRESRPEIHLIFKIKKNAALIDNFRKDILNVFQNIIQKRMKNKIYRRFLYTLKDDLQNIITEYMKTSSFSVGISDLIADKTTQDNIIHVITTQKQEVNSIIEKVHLGVFENDTSATNNAHFESSINNFLFSIFVNMFGNGLVQGKLRLVNRNFPLFIL